ncbi:MAG: hypothetical protein ACLGI9_08320, partial [Thermoanaerobaculia bacterium]
MTIRFKTLFTLAVTHTYYGGVCRDLGFVLPPGAEPLLRGGRLIAKVLDGRLHVLFEAAEDSTPVALMAGRTLRIGLKQLNPHFPNFTVLPVDPAAGVALYTNTADPDALGAPQAVRLTGPVFSHALQQADRPVTVKLLDADGLTLAEQTVSDAGRAEVSFDLTGQEPGFRKIEELYPGNVKRTADYLLDPELAREGVFGVAEVRIDAGFYTTPAAFEIAFEARQETLRYYLVVKKYSAAEIDQLSVSDAGFTEEGRPEVTFTKVPAAAFTPAEIPPSLLGDAGATVVLFRSQAPVARRERGR